jgi:ATP-binding cassette subfamily B protein
MGYGLMAADLVFQLLSGLAPVAFILASSTVIARVPAAARAGLGSGAWHGLFDALVLTGALVLVQQMIYPVQLTLAEIVAMRVDDKVRDRVLAASFAPVGTELHEDQDSLSQIVGLVDWSKGPGFTAGLACGGVLALVGRYTTWLVGAALVGVAYRWWAALAVAASALFMRVGIRSGVGRLAEYEWSFAPHWRRRSYLEQLMTTPGPGKEVRVFGLFDWVFGHFRDTALAAVMPVWKMRRRTVARPYAASVPVALALSGLVAVEVARAAARGSLSLGRFSFVLQALTVVGALGDFFYESDHQTEFGTRSYGALRRFEDAQATAPGGGADDGEGGVAVGTVSPPRHAIRFESVVFSYPGAGAPVLNGLDLTIPAGRSLAVVGLNGAGKTTLVKLLARLYEPDEGRVSVDGTDLRHLPPREWRRQLGAIFQDFVHYDLSLRDNVGLGAPDLGAVPGLVEGLLASVGALDFATALPQGLGTILSRAYEGGADLSGGQWQRIAIARALMAVQAGATVLVLDEPTANLDVRAEAEFYQRFLELTRGLTTVLISHRFSTVRQADRIAVLAGGKVVEEGGHADLLALGGRYARMFRAQAERFADDDADADADGEGEARSL